MILCSREMMRASREQRHVDGTGSRDLSRSRQALPGRSFRRGVGVDRSLLRGLPAAEHLHPGDRRGLPVPRGRGLPLPRDFPPWQTVRWWWDRFRREGAWEAAAHALTRKARVAAGRRAEPRTGPVDTRSVRCGPRRGERGWDGGKRLNGRKRHVLTCSAGFLLATLVTAASVHDKHGVDPLLARSHAAGWHLRGLVGDGSYAGDAARHGATFTVAPRPQQHSGFVPIPLRWRVEQGLGILMTRNRRLVRDWEQVPEVSETVMLVANLRRLIRFVVRSC